MGPPCHTVKWARWLFLGIKLNQFSLHKFTTVDFSIPRLGSVYLGNQEQLILWIYLIDYTLHFWCDKESQIVQLFVSTCICSLNCSKYSMHKCRYIPSVCQYTVLLVSSTCYAAKNQYLFEKQYPFYSMRADNYQNEMILIYVKTVT